MLLFQGTGRHAVSAAVGGNSATKITSDVTAFASNRVTAFRYSVGAGEAGNNAVTVEFALDVSTNQHVMSAHLVVGGVVDAAAVGVNGTTDTPKSVTASATPTNTNNYMLACMMGAGAFTNQGDETWANATRIDGAKMATGSTRDISIASQEDVAIAAHSMTCTTPLSGKTAIIVVAISEAP